MKLSIWDVLTGILLLAILLVGGVVMSVFANPYNTALNPFPPQKLPPTVVIPSATPTFRSMPATWTPNAETEQAYAALGYTLVPSDTAGPSPTGFTLTFTDTPEDTETPTETETPTPWETSTTYVYSGPTSIPATACSGCTATPIPATKTATSMPNISSASEIHGVSNNVWQKNTANPVFLLPVTPGMFAFYYYYGLDPNGGSSESATPSPSNYIAIVHDAKSIDFTPPAVSDCGAYYLRIETLWATKSGSTVVYSTSGWNTVFIFKYDNTPPVPVFYAATGIKGAMRGIQNISGSANLSWGNWNGGDSPIPSLIPSGDYRAYGPNDDGVDVNQIYQCSGVKSYQIYWGPDPNGVSNIHTSSSASYNPGAVKPNTSYYLRINSIDQLGNASGWRRVALDDTYSDLSSEPTLDQSAFYYDTVKPNNITSITENNYGYVSDSAFTNQDSPDFTFAGGDDPVGYKPDPWGYDVVWSTNQNSTTYTFIPNPEFTPKISASGTYYLKVRDVDWAMNSPIDWMTFVYKFDNVGPVGVSKVTESNGVPYNVFQNTKNDPSFSWDVTKIKDPGDSTTSSGMASPIVYYLYWGTDPGGVPSSPQTTNTFAPGPQSTGVYYLRIMVLDNVGNQTITTPFIMKYDNTPPDAPIITEHDLGTKNNHPTFTWAAHEVGSGIAGYYYFWGTNAGGTSNTLTKTTSLDGKVHSGTTYYLWVVAKDNAGNLSAPATTSFLYP